MRWVDETGRHEGYLAAVLADGSEPGPVADGRTTWWLYNGADGPRAVGVRGACECGWRGAETHPIDFGDDEATEGVEQRTGPYADWEYHVDQAEGMVPRDVEQLLAALEKRIGQLSERQSVTALRVVARVEKAVPGYGIGAVRAARANLVSWEAIGKALGCSRQAAHERFARHLSD
ncbi:hypothetical protein [Kitasatospora sp. GAS204B]|uniref:hypothetical protein n=1 Tax=unclassified Kitasatospora TaxID=2633591 RepID=UPI00247649DD|nr:hypothetical protein [Kitasatospora sp. GAS204B]MDH6121399.1 hypothetical protein [Kitasatospora sp. GAS204B]